MDAQAIMQQIAAAATPAAQGAAPTLGGSLGGASEDLLKALQASNYQPDVSTLSGGGAR